MWVAPEEGSRPPAACEDGWDTTGDRAHPGNCPLRQFRDTLQSNLNASVNFAHPTRYPRKSADLRHR
jgi:hypothetical protein